jgi:hypothetical protein
MSFLLKKILFGCHVIASVRCEAISQFRTGDCFVATTSPRNDITFRANCFYMMHSTFAVHKKPPGVTQYPEEVSEKEKPLPLKEEVE